MKDDCPDTHRLTKLETKLMNALQKALLRKQLLVVRYDKGNGNITPVKQA